MPIRALLAIRQVAAARGAEEAANLRLTVGIAVNVLRCVLEPVVVGLSPVLLPVPIKVVGVLGIVLLVRVQPRLPVSVVVVEPILGKHVGSGTAVELRDNPSKVDACNNGRVGNTGNLVLLLFDSVKLALLLAKDN